MDDVSSEKQWYRLVLQADFQTMCTLPATFGEIDSKCSDLCP